VAEEEIKLRLKRIEGQVRGIYHMIEEARPCEDVLTQLLAVRTALDSVASQVVASHIDDCLSAQSPVAARRSIQRTIELLLRTT
jgi:DNA-binding FrmR family transcriptional regulator